MSSRFVPSTHFCCIKCTVALLRGIKLSGLSSGSSERPSIKFLIRESMGGFLQGRVKFQPFPGHFPRKWCASQFALEAGEFFNLTLAEVEVEEDRIGLK